MTDPEAQEPDGAGEPDSQFVMVDGDSVDVQKLRGSLCELREEKRAAPPFSRIDVIRAVIDEIEGALDDGATYASVLETLQAHGVRLTPAAFQSCLSRVRKERREAGK